MPDLSLVPLADGVLLFWPWASEESGLCGVRGGGGCGGCGSVFRLPVILFSWPTAAMCLQPFNSGSKTVIIVDCSTKCRRCCLVAGFCLVICLSAGLAGRIIYAVNLFAI